MTRYDLVYLLATPVLLPYLGWRYLTRGKYTESAGGMLGRRLPNGEQAAAFTDGSLWLHAVSVGEIAAARAVAEGLGQLRPELPLVVSTITETGQAAARRFFAEQTTTYFPADLSPVVRRFQRVFRPRVFVLLETEIWPNFLTLAARDGTRCFMINAKLSDRSFPRYRRFRRVLAPALAALEGICTQTEQDAQRFAELGLDPDRIRVTGNCKFDLDQEPLSPAERREMLERFGMNPDRRWIVAGSTHPGEEELLLETYKAVQQKVPEAGLLLCPRHPERFDEAARLVGDAGRRVGRASAPGEPADPEVVVLDQMGVLARAYGLGEVTIVAGSFCQVGGHNLLEAAAHAVPVLYGPHMHSQREIHRLFVQAEGGLQVSPETLGPTLIELLSDETRRREEGAKARRVLDRNQGSAARSVAVVGEWLGGVRDSGFGDNYPISDLQ